MIQPVGYIALVFLLGVVAGFISTSYLASLALLLGITLAWPVKVFFSRMYAWGRQRNLKWLPLLLRAIVPIILLVTCMLLFPNYLMFNIFPGVVAEYRATIEPIDQAFDVFKISEDVAFAEGNTLPFYSSPDSTVFIKLGEWQVASHSRGFLLREVHFMPLQADASGHVDYTLPNGTKVSGRLCSLVFNCCPTYGLFDQYSMCPESKAEVRDLPSNSFFAAKDATDIQAQKYIDTETVSWSVTDLERGITFAYIPPPYHYLRPLLLPFIGASYLSQWVIGLFGFAATFLLLPVLRPILPDMAKGKLKDWFDKASKRKSPLKATLIVSSRGDEKEIEVKDSKKK